MAMITDDYGVQVQVILPKDLASYIREVEEITEVVEKWLPGNGTLAKELERILVRYKYERR